MRLAAASVGGCAVFAGGEVNVSHNDASGLVDILCPAAPDAPAPAAHAAADGARDVAIAELSARRYEMASASLGSRAYFAGGNPGAGHGDPSASSRIDVWDASTKAWSVLTLPNPRDRLAAASVEALGVVCFGGGEGGGGVHGAVDCLRETPVARAHAAGAVPTH